MPLSECASHPAGGFTTDRDVGVIGTSGCRPCDDALPRKMHRRRACMSPAVCDDQRGRRADDPDWPRDIELPLNIRYALARTWDGPPSCARTPTFGAATSRFDDRTQCPHGSNAKVHRLHAGRAQSAVEEAANFGRRARAHAHDQPRAWSLPNQEYAHAAPWAIPSTLRQSQSTNHVPHHYTD